MHGLSESIAVCFWNIYWNDWACIWFNVSHSLCVFRRSSLCATPERLRVKHSCNKDFCVVWRIVTHRYASWLEKERRFYFCQGCGTVWKSSKSQPNDSQPNLVKWLSELTHYCSSGQENSAGSAYQLPVTGSARLLGYFKGGLNARDGGAPWRRPGPLTFHQSS